MSILPPKMTLIIWVNSLEIVFAGCVMMGISLIEMFSVQNSEKEFTINFKECDRNYKTLIVYALCFILILANLMNIFKQKRMEMEIEESKIWMSRNYMQR